MEQAQGAQAQVQAQVEVREKVKRDMSYTIKEETYNDGKDYTVLTTDKYTIRLFPSRFEPQEGKKTELIFNASVMMNLSEFPIQFHTQVRKYVDNPENLVFGQDSQRRGFRAVVTEWNRDKGQSYERMSIPVEKYDEIRGIIADYYVKHVLSEPVETTEPIA